MVKFKRLELIEVTRASFDVVELLEGKKAI